MPLRILVVPDKFKGTLTAQKAAEAIARGWRSARPDDLLELIPMSDGGDGFGEVLSDLLHADPEDVDTQDAARRPCRANWWWHVASSTAIVESAGIIGLAMLPRAQFHPFDLDTTGVAKVLRAIEKKNPGRCIIGVGGSATNDGGFGLARGLGWTFRDPGGVEIERWIQLNNVAEITPPSRALNLGEIIIGVDVQNPLLGPQGCSRIYGPQKGLRPEDLDAAESALTQLAYRMRDLLGRDVCNDPGAGAAGGLGFGLRAFCGGRIAPGFKLFQETAKIESRLSEFDLVLTGEGAIDNQTLMGKGVGELALMCRQYRVPCVAFAGVIPDRERAKILFHAAHALTPDLVSREIALTETAVSLAGLARQAAMAWDQST